MSADDTAAVPVARPVDLSDYSDELKIAARPRSEQLKTIKDMSTAWFASVGAFTGLTGIAAFAAREQITTLAESPQQTAIVLFAVAYALVLVGLFLGALAAQGVPRFVLNDPLAIRDALETAIDSASSRLKASRLLVFASAGLLGVAGYISVTGDTKPSPLVPPTMMVVQDDGSVLCGQITSSVDGVVSLKTPSERVRSVHVSSPDRLVEVATCVAD